MSWALLVSSIGLVVATCGLGVFTWGLVSEAAKTRAEMEETRRLSVRPHLALGVRVIAPCHGVVTIENLGPGAAMDIEIELTYEPGGFVRNWAWPTLAAGASHEFLLPMDSGNLDAVAAKGVVARAQGSCRDIYGADSPFDAKHDFKAWWTLARQADRRFVTHPVERIARQLEEIGKSVEKLTRSR